MKRRQFLAIFTALAVSLCSAAVLTGCTSKTLYYKDMYYDENGVARPIGDPVSVVVSEEESSKSESTAGTTTDTTPSETTEESSEEESSAPVAESSAPAEESSAPAEESSAPAEESSEQQEEPSAAAEGIKFTFKKPAEGKWSKYDDICAYITNDAKEGEPKWPGEPMTDNGDGTFSYTYTGTISDPIVTFTCNKGKVAYPASGGLALRDGVEYTVE